MIDFSAPAIQEAILTKDLDSLSRIILFGDVMRDRVCSKRNPFVRLEQPDYAMDPLFVAQPNQTEWI